MKQILFLLLFFILLGCNFGNKTNNTKTNSSNRKKEVFVPNFNRDSAFLYVEQQVNFGSRVPNTKAHKQCAEYLERKLKEFGADVIVQKAQVKSFDNKTLSISNIIGQYKSESKNRVLLFAHWDSRPFADQCTDKSRIKEPILGANDGASGVGVLLEIARQIKMSPPNVGVDIIFFDAEDYGQPEFSKEPNKQDTWCLGSQYWSKNPHRKGYYAQYGILLDMVGGKNATFYQEIYSVDMARKIVKGIWNTASELGYSSYFIFDRGGYITDDHIYVNKFLGIPCVDIIQHDPTTETNFGRYWHTHDDNMDSVDKNTLKAVGQTVLKYVYSTK